MINNVTRITSKICFSVFVLVASATAQSVQRTEPSPAAAGPGVNVSVGYSRLALAVPAAQRTNLNGLDLSGTVDFNPHWGITLDSNYVRTARIPNTPHMGYVLSFLGGPVFYPIEHGGTRIFIHGLAGTALVDGATPGVSGAYHYGWVMQFSYAAGAGFERAFVGPFSARVGADYLRTAFFNSAGSVQPQNNFRITLSLVCRLKEHQHRVLVR